MSYPFERIAKLLVGHGLRGEARDNATALKQGALCVIFHLRSQTGERMKRSAHHKFTVYIARETRRSDLALERLTKICEEEIPGEYEIEVIDVAKRPDLARARQIIATPAVFRTLPAPVIKSIGDLSG